MKQTKHGNLEYVEINGEKEVSIVRTKLMNEPGYSPYCGAPWSKKCSMPRTKWNGSQFVCPECGFISEFPIEFITRYKEKWNK